MTSRPDLTASRSILLQARRAGIAHLLESDAKNLLDAIGIPTPARILLSGPAGAEGLHDPPFPGRGIVLKALAPGLLHKTEAGAVRMLPDDRAAVIAEIRAMARRLDGQRIDGYLLEERVPYDASPGHEFLLGMRWTSDFGPVVTLGAGGLHAELLAGSLREDEALAVFSPALTPSPKSIESALSRVAAVRLATQSQRGRPPAIAIEALVDVVRRFLTLAQAVMPDLLLELEVNPLVISEGRLVALDGLATPAPAEAPPPGPAAPRPVEKIGRLLQPGSIALVGVSEKTVNPGRIILRNVLRAGFDRDRVVIVKPGCESLDGVRCVPSLDALPAEPAFHGAERRADLIVLSVSAGASPELIDVIARDRRGEAVILIPGGLDELAEGRELVARMRAAIERSRAGAWRGPVINGGNCLGIRSLPGKIDTFFIPEHKLPRPTRSPDPVAFITGSGAFAVSKSSKLGPTQPLYTISIGNQTDLTAADYLEYLSADPRVEVFAVYLEGFRPLDGARFLAAADTIVASGGTVILYRGGRSPAGRAAASSHTAAIAGDAVVTRALAREAGVVVAESLEEFEDLTRLFAMLRGRSVTGLSLGAVSNAGYETVAMADNLGPFRLPAFAGATTALLGGALERAGLGSIATVRNPLDVTPILNDAGTEEVLRAVLEDPGVDVGVVGCVPMTGALQTLPRGEGHAEDLASPEALVPRLVRLAAECPKAWVAVVDAGPLYDPMARALEEGGVPVFRSADRALGVFGRYCAARLAHPHPLRPAVPIHGPEPELVIVGTAPPERPRWGSALIWS
ncbi:MAG TPA: acetate--CoA ligase family protein [Candidatus Omnitrophota bacterium]|nr:acetate--CoA ligase family protein [Candidatus Omnitrophota bacterium]